MSLKGKYQAPGGSGGATSAMRAVKNTAMLGRDMQGAMGRRLKLTDALEKLKRVK